ncbi:DUF4783 domain-containing protein [Mucilaginibacter myungsuensis]|uniref:DUF4783 domain-containing protein n=1 Tax=Mucilaginibacter myungsuensis TaxID=649104 RepID=A0A929KX36_9SPHI|nr:DUF4783 domain-containing protein [Mucilaginibacter myungsuensis]MBE9663249.1 DUF4783 domain-containing protein [Mucilaginibacter myungsuensis]MDN3598882.1 DUF4783 domain-containing protein [Mucilaginibacter myungsuensis]
MKRLACLLLFLLPLALTSRAADPIDNAVELIKSGNAKELAKIFAVSVELTLLDDENIVNPAQAEAALTTFFKAHAVKSVTVVHKVNSNASVKYAVLSLVTSSGTYRTTVSLKLVKDQFLINELKVEDKK